jgi:hypothetical protein
MRLGLVLVCCLVVAAGCGGAKATTPVTRFAACVQSSPAYKVTSAQVSSQAATIRIGDSGAVVVYASGVKPQNTIFALSITDLDLMKFGDKRVHGLASLNVNGNVGAAVWLRIKRCLAAPVGA